MIILEARKLDFLSEKLKLGGGITIVTSTNSLSFATKKDGLYAPKHYYAKSPK